MKEIHLHISERTSLIEFPYINFWISANVFCIKQEFKIIFNSHYNFTAITLQILKGFTYVMGHMKQIIKLQYKIQRQMNLSIKRIKTPEIN